MKALVYPAWDTLEIRDDLPEPVPAPGEVVLDVAAVGICGSEVEAVAARSPRRTPPLVMGHEFCGMVAAVGAGVTDVREGDRVVASSLIACGRCEDCRAGRPHLCPRRQIFGMNRPGAFAERVAVPASVLYALPERVSPLHGALVEPLANAVHVWNLIAPRFPETVVVIGCGAIGLMCLQVARAGGGLTLVAVDTNEARLEMAHAVGAEPVFNPVRGDAVEAIRDFTRDPRRRHGAQRPRRRARRAADQRLLCRRAAGPRHRDRAPRARPHRDRGLGPPVPARRRREGVPTTPHRAAQRIRQGALAALMAYAPFDLTGKVALVTGGNSGIGLGMAEALAQAGAAVCIWGTNEAKNAVALAQLAKHGGRVSALRCDVGEEAEVDRAFEATLAALGRVDACFANAGVSGRGVKSFTEMTAAEWRRVTRVNLDGAFFTLRAAARHMTAREGGGSLAVTASLAAISGAARSEHYAASKGGVISMMRALAVELARHGIRANAILPGWIETPMTAPAFGWDKFVEKVFPRVPMRRWGTGADFGGIAVYLASDASAYHTGDTFVIDGGYSLF
ncbi:MAG: SDR family oxidoreductase [Candidatus Rokubacteria bacterium]|nr:SDR family oxidoreductase [Candidatus Rokubacteria bacterium]